MGWVGERCSLAEKPAAGLTVLRAGEQAGVMSLLLSRKNKLPIALLGVGGLAVGAGGLYFLSTIGLQGLGEMINTAMAVLRGLGPWVFFSAMAILPALGAPMLAFTIPAGEAFAGQLGLTGVIAAALVAVALNLALTYWLARYALRPVLTRWLTRYGYSIPRVTAKNALSVLLVVRLTPGPPYSLQCFLLGLAETPFRIYMLVSWLAVSPIAVGAIVLGEGLFKGNYKAAVMGMGLLVVASIGLQWLRKKYLTREN